MVSLRERLLDVRRDVRARALAAVNELLIDQHVERLARRDPRDAKLLGELALGRERLLGLPLARVDGVREPTRDLQIERRGVVPVGTQRVQALAVREGHRLKWP